MARVAPQDDASISFPNDAQPASRWFVPAEKLAGGETSAKWKSNKEYLILNKFKCLELSAGQKAIRVVALVLKVVFLFAIIFIFICTLNLLTDAFKLIGVRGIGKKLLSLF